MPRAQDRARSARSRKNGARSATFKNSGARSATIEYYGARSATIESRVLGALKLASEARNENVPAKRADFLCLVPLFRKVFFFFNFSTFMYFKTKNFEFFGHFFYIL